MWDLWLPALVFALAECGSAGFFLLAQRYIPAAEGNLLIYLWPGMVVAAAAAFRLVHVTKRQVLGVITGFLGAAILVGGGGRFALSLEGIVLALAGGGSWAVYCVFRLKRPRAATGFLAQGCAIAAIVCGTLHLWLEPSVVPGWGASAAVAGTGIIPTALATIAWDNGIRRGDGQRLAVMAYGTPLCSALILAALGLETLTLRLAIGACVIVAAGILSRTETRGS